ncbi:hypothetical protein [Paenibacillus lautus]|uniref:hypothetical protein n=1 Tax=Paenibacillus lautus TaxID=1401 RepID=UPI003D2D2A55
MMQQSNIDNFINEVSALTDFDSKKFNTKYIDFIQISTDEKQIIDYLEDSLRLYYSIADSPQTGTKYHVCFLIKDIDEEVKNNIEMNGSIIEHYSPSAHEKFKKIKLDYRENKFYMFCNNQVIVMERNNKVTMVISRLTKNTLKETKRLIREQMLYGERENNNEVPLHSGAIVVDNIGMLVMGNKGSGKTSTILAMLNSGANFVSNDLVFFKKCNNDYYAMGTPESIRIGIGTLKQYSILGELVPQKYKKYDKKSKELWNIPKDEKEEIEWYDLEKYFPTRVEYNYVEVKIILFPNISKNTEHKITKIPSIQMMEYLNDNNLSVYSKQSPGLWLDCIKEDHRKITKSSDSLLDSASKGLFGYEIFFDGTEEVLRDSVRKIVRLYKEENYEVHK